VYNSGIERITKIGIFGEHLIMVWPFSNPFLDELQDQIKSYKGDLPPGQFKSVGDYPFGKGSPQILGKLAGFIILQAIADGASCIRLSFEDGKMYYTVDGTEYNMIPAPAYAAIDMIRYIVDSSGASFEQPGSIEVNYLGQKRSLAVECVWEKQSLQIILPIE